MSRSDSSEVTLAASNESDTPTGKPAAEKAITLLPSEAVNPEIDATPVEIGASQESPEQETGNTESQPSKAILKTNGEDGQRKPSSTSKEPKSLNLKLEEDELSEGSDVEWERPSRPSSKSAQMKSRLKVFPKRIEQVNHFNRIVESRLLCLEETTTAFDKKLYRLINGVDKLPPAAPPPTEAKVPYMEPELNFQVSKGLEKPLSAKSDGKKVPPSHQIDVFVGEPEAQRAENPGRREPDFTTMEDIDVDEQAIASEAALKHSSKSTDEKRLVEEMAKLKSKHFPDRIRINAPGILYLLRRYLVAEDTAVDTIILRPFKPLLHNKENIRAMLPKVLQALTRMINGPANKEGGLFEVTEMSDNALKTRQPHRTVKGKEESSKTGGIAPLTEEPLTSDAITTEQWDRVLRKLEIFDENNGCVGKNMGGWSTITEVRKSFESMDNLFDHYLLPGHMDFRRRRVDTVRFCDLWHLFHTGDLVVTKQSAALDDTGIQEQLGMRVLMTSGGRRALLPSSSAPRFPTSITLRSSEEKLEAVNGVNPFCIHAYYLDFNGARPVPVRRRIVIAPYPGERDIRDLDVFPCEYASDTATTLRERGKNFVKYAAAPTAFYVDCKGLELSTREELNDKVIVDMKGYFQINPDDIPRYQVPEHLDVSETSDCSRGRNCSSYSLSCGHRNPIVHDQVSDLAVYKKYIAENPLFKSSLATADAPAIKDEDLGICHYRVFAYKFRSREWVQVNVKDLKEPDKEEKGRGFEKLVLSEGHKSILQSQVQEHFRKRGSQATTGSSENDMDLVRGKGQGLIILLHGAPGVGKTCTAECIADFVEKPLYPITCGDLGSTADDVEKNLKKHFTLASRWDCVMLLDEADVFLAKRKLEDLQRNSIVSVFLRMLEYYKGLLFLTTNRVGTFDEAFTSRVHISLFYPDFDKETTLEVWQTFIDQTTYVLEKSGRSHVTIKEKEIMKFAKKHWKDSGDSKRARWNGRQIRNAFHTAIAMAEFKARSQKDGKGYDDRKDVEISVGREEFEKIASTAREFDTYMIDTMGTTFQVKASKEGLRKEQKNEKEKSKKKKKSRSKSKDSDSSSSESESEDDDDAKKKKKKKTSSKSKKRSDSSSNNESEDDDDSDSD